MLKCFQQVHLMDRLGSALDRALGFSWLMAAVPVMCPVVVRVEPARDGRRR